jgi:hypothetical protein
MTNDDIKNKVGIELLKLLDEYFIEYWSDDKIRNFLEGGIEVGVNDPIERKTYPHTFDVSVLTDGFLKDARQLLAKIHKNVNKEKV